MILNSLPPVLANEPYLADVAPLGRDLRLGYVPRRPLDGDLSQALWRQGKPTCRCLTPLISSFEAN